LPYQALRNRDRERAALEWTESVTLVADTHVPDAVWERVQPQFTPAELVDLTRLVNTINSCGLLRINSSMALPDKAQPHRHIPVGLREAPPIGTRNASSRDDSRRADR